MPAETRQDSVAPPARGVWGSVLILSLIWLGLLGGTAAGAAWFVPEGSGLAGPAIALSYGLGAAAAGILAGALVAWRARPETVRAIARPVLFLSLLAVAVVGWLVATLQNRPRGSRADIRPDAETAR